MLINYILIKRFKMIIKSFGISIIFTILLLVNSEYSFADDAQSYYQNGYQYFSQGDYKRAEENYKKAIELDPKFENAHYWLGKVYRQTGKYNNAITQWIEVLKINPRNPYAFRYLNESFRDTSRVRSGVAGDYFLEGLKVLEIEDDAFLNQDNISSYTLLSAIPYFKKAVELENSIIGAHYWMAEVYLTLSKKISWQYTSLAISSFEKVIGIEEQNNPFLFQRPSEYCYAYQELIQIFQSLGLNERKDNLLNQLKKAKSIPFEQALNNKGHSGFSYPDSIELIKTDSKELIEIWRYEKEDKAFRIVNKEVVGEEKYYK
ncbi:MAG: tetratricopeptide repeat protein [Atribacterota bacterium]|nr:tetratricopeptide repeat protein [Atribacterota bacterium]MDD4895220.1 tetratricopeptide repeat protein [Atribacterota bacterium]MDD5636462.1 tetratricopeptide repeat protein [Atribacterota bacterium]